MLVPWSASGAAEREAMVLPVLRGSTRGHTHNGRQSSSDEGREELAEAEFESVGSVDSVE